MSKLEKRVDDLEKRVEEEEAMNTMVKAAVVTAAVVCVPYGIFLIATDIASRCRLKRNKKRLEELSASLQSQDNSYQEVEDEAEVEEAE